MKKRTTKPEYAPYLVSIIKHMRGVTREELLDEVYNVMEHRLHPEDLVVLPNNEPRWRNQAQHMLDGLMDDGVVIENNGLLILAEP